MAHKPRVVDLELRAQRQKSYLTARTVASCFPRVEHIALELRFSGLDAMAFVAPYRQIYTREMQAYFLLQCPSRECSGGGFDQSKEIASAVQGNAPLVRGKMQCGGSLSASRLRGDPCPVTLNFDIERVLCDAP